LAGWLALAGAAPARAADDRPNILLLMAEDLSSRIGAYGDRVARTPHIDRLAEQGTRYTRAFTTAGVCAPSRAAIIMGVHQDEWGAGHMRATAGGYVAVPPEDWKAFPEWLRRAGYYTVNSGKTDYQMGAGLAAPFRGPSSIWDEPAGDDWRGRAPGQPFFAYLTLEQTHESQVWPTWQFSPLAIVMSPLRAANHWSWDFETDPAAVRVPPYYPDTPTVRADIARHYNNLGNVDRAVGELLAKLEADGLADDTLVVFAGDHGDGLPRAKRWLYDSGTRIPLVVRWPGKVAPGAVDDGLVSGIDFAPTFLRAAGAPLPDYLEGRVFAGPERAPAPAVVFAARDRIDERLDRVRSVRGPRFLYIRNLMPDQPYVLPIAFRDQMPMMKEMLARAAAGTLRGPAALWFRKTRDPEELYDTAADPDDVVNLAGDAAYADVLARFRTILDLRLASGKDLGLLPEDELRERFWPGGKQPETPPPTVRWRDGRAALKARHGASVVFRPAGAETWSLYTEPVTVAPGASLEARAVRYGWAESVGVRVEGPPLR